LADKLARVFPDRRDPTRVLHSLVDMFRSRMFAICCGYETPTTLIICGPIPHSSWPADGYRTPAAICVPSRPCRVWRMLRACAT
jgi:hypothetical protein